MLENWHTQLKQCLNTAESCNNYFGVEYFTDNDFVIKIPKPFADLIDKNNINDPLLLQVLPNNKKITNTEKFYKEPLFDSKNSPINGIIYKYSNRVLLIVSSVCAINCRYCFRQNFAYKEHNIFHNLPKVLNFISANSQINEVILSGGDPLSISDNKLAKLITKLALIKHITTVRIHTRTLSVLPSRITKELVNILLNSKVKIVLVFHINHSKEITSEFINKIKKLSGITLLNQSVLLKGVNDNVNTLVKLSNKLFQIGILPYYLHQLDKVEGAEHFLISNVKAINLHNEIKKQLSGYLVPKLVQDNNDTAKTWL